MQLYEWFYQMTALIGEKAVFGEKVEAYLVSCVQDTICIAEFSSANFTLHLYNHDFLLLSSGIRYNTHSLLLQFPTLFLQ